MKKFGKFLFGALSLAAAAGGVYCLYKNRLAKDADLDDFDDPDDEIEDDIITDSENREYVSINITGGSTAADEEAESDEVSQESEAGTPAEDAAESEE